MSPKAAFTLDTSDPRFAVVHLSGRLDIAGTGAVELPLAEVVAAYDKLAVDLLQVTYISSIGLRLLLLAAREIERRGGRLVVVNPHPQAAQVLAGVGLENLVSNGPADNLAALFGLPSCTFLPVTGGQQLALRATREVVQPRVGRAVSDAEFWVFAYGSLMWDPGFRYREAETGLLRGYHRRFCLLSPDYRGTPERPGLVLGLDRGGSCHGIAFRIAPLDVPSVQAQLWRRELREGAYHVRLLHVQLADRTVLAQCLVADRRHRLYAGRLDIDAMARLIDGGRGERGDNRAYLENTLRHLHKLGIEDRGLERLAERVRELNLERGQPQESSDATVNQIRAGYQPDDYQSAAPHSSIIAA